MTLHSYHFAISLTKTKMTSIDQIITREARQFSGTNGDLLASVIINNVLTRSLVEKFDDKEKKIYMKVTNRHNMDKIIGQSIEDGLYQLSHENVQDVIAIIDSLAISGCVIYARANTFSSSENDVGQSDLEKVDLNKNGNKDDKDVKKDTPAETTS